MAKIKFIIPNAHIIALATAKGLTPGNGTAPTTAWAELALEAYYIEDARNELRRIKHDEVLRQSISGLETDVAAITKDVT